MPCQSREALAWYNDWIRALARDNADLGIEVFDGRALTSNLATKV